jgi:hypothetical protein
LVCLSWSLSFEIVVVFCLFLRDQTSAQIGLCQDWVTVRGRAVTTADVAYSDTAGRGPT